MCGADISEKMEIRIFIGLIKIVSNSRKKLRSKNGFSRLSGPPINILKIKLNNCL
jgi:hypothetical protein